MFEEKGEIILNEIKCTHILHIPVFARLENSEFLKL